MARSERTELMVHQRNATASAVMRRLVRDGPTGRKELAASTGTSFTTITKTVAELIELGALVEATAPARSARGAGRPVVPLDVPAAGRVVVGAHLHPKRTSGGAFTLRGEQVLWREIPQVDQSPAGRIADTAEFVAEIVDEAGADAVVGIGVATPWAEHHPGHAPRLAADVDHAELRASMAERLPHPFRVESNVRALAVEQHWWGDGGDDVLTVLVGRSLGVAQIRRDELVWNGPAAGGVVSHLLVPGSTHRCDCGQIGCVKVTCTDDALVAEAVATGLLPPDASQRDLYPADDVAGLARLRRERAHGLGQVVPLIMSLVAPSETVVRGRIGTPEEIEECLRAIRDRYRELVGHDPRVRYEGGSQADFWARASAALALDRYLVSPLEHEEDLAVRG